MGYPDGPNQYAAFGANPANLSDAFGLDAAGINVTPDGDTPLRDLTESEFVNQLRLSDIPPQEWDDYLSRAGYAGSQLRRSRAFVGQMASDLAPVEDALMVASAPIAVAGLVIAGPEVAALGARSAAAANGGSFALLRLGARVAPRTVGALTGPTAVGAYLAFSDAPVSRPVLAGGRGLGGNRLLDRLVGETQGAVAQADRVLRAGGTGRTAWGAVYQRVAGSATWFEFLARRNAIHQISETLLAQNRYVSEAKRAGVAVLFNRGSALGAMGRGGRLLRPDIQVGLPNGTWGIIDITTAGAVGKVEKYLHAADPSRTPYLIDVFDEVR